jgi:nitrogen fixation protein NifU and related proteins
MEDELYRQELLERYRGAGNKKRMLSPDIHAQDSNPLCGDNIEIFMRVDKDGKIKDATFDGNGCVISMASASILLEQLIGKNLKEAEEITREDMLDMLGLELTPTRVKCAMLGLSTVKKGAEEKRAEKIKKETESTNKKIVKIVSVKKQIKLKRK